jgi:hypothetical protein
MDTHDHVAVALVVGRRKFEVARLRLVDGAPVVAQVELVLDRKKVVRHGSSLPTDSSSSNEQVALSNKLESFSLRFL